MLALDENLTRNILRVCRVDAHFERAFRIPSARTGLELGRLLGETDERSALRHTIADRKREVYLAQESLGLLIHRRTSDDEQRQIASERIYQLVLDGGVDCRVEQRHLHRDAQRSLVEHWHNLLAVYFFENQRHRNDYGRTHILQRLDKNLRRRNLAEQRDMTADRQRQQEVHRTAVGVGQRQERQRTSALGEVSFAVLVRHRLQEYEVAREVVHREHYALRISGRSAGVVEQYQLVVRHVAIADVVYRESVRITLAVVLRHAVHALGQLLAVALENDVIVGQRKHRLRIRHVGLFETVPVRIGEEEQTALRVVHDVGDVRRREILQNRHDYRTVGDCREVDDAPARSVAAHEGDFVLRLDACLVEYYMDLGNLFRQSVVRVRFSRKVICKSRHFAILAEALLVHFNQILF